jgi:hypothetical protein
MTYATVNENAELEVMDFFWKGLIYANATANGDVFNDIATFYRRT